MSGLNVLDVVALATALRSRCSRCGGTWPMRQSRRGELDWPIISRVRADFSLLIHNQRPVPGATTMTTWSLALGFLVVLQVKPTAKPETAADLVTLRDGSVVLGQL